MIPAMEIAVLDVPRGEFSIEEPWAIPDACTPVALKRATDGGAPRLATSVTAYYDDDFLTVIFDADDDEVVATYLDHDAPLWQEDVVEIFIAPEGLTTYFEIEVNPLGTTFDARIDSPDGVRATMTTDLAWTCDGLFAALRRDDGKRIQIVIRIPFASLNNHPKSGDEWRAHLFPRGRSEGHRDEVNAGEATPEK